MPLCRCGCGVEVRGQYVRGHHWKVKREATGLPEEKVCEWCERTYARAEIGRQRAAHWRARRFCSMTCRNLAYAWGLVIATGEAHHAWKGDAAKPGSGRDRARALYRDPNPCACGAPGEHRHHRDGDPLNNAPENVEWKCVACHLGDHMRERHARRRAHA